MNKSTLCISRKPCKNRDLTSVAPGDDGKVSGVGDSGAGGSKARPVPRQQPERGSDHPCRANQTRKTRRIRNAFPGYDQLAPRNVKEGWVGGRLTGGGDRDDDPLPPVLGERRGCLRSRSVGSLTGGSSHPRDGGAGGGASR